MNDPENITQKYSKKRTCGTCSECCKGYLNYGNIFEYQYVYKSPCHFLDNCKQCTIHENKPDGCKNYQCSWLSNSVVIPEWMKPEHSGVIISDLSFFVGENQPPIPYWNVVECGKKIRPEILNWILLKCESLKINIHYQVDGVDYYFGDENFNQHISTMYNNQNKS